MQSIERALMAMETAMGISLPHYALMQRLRESVEGNRLQLSGDLLGAFNVLGEIVGGVVNVFVEIENPTIEFIEGQPGLVGDPGREIESGVRVATPENTKTRITGEVTYLGLDRVLLTAEFFLFKGVPHAILKFEPLPELANQVPSWGIGNVFPDIPIVRAMRFTAPAIILSSSDQAYDPRLDAAINRGFNFYGNVEVENSGDRTWELVGGLLHVRQLAVHAALTVDESLPKYVLEGSVRTNTDLIQGENFQISFSRSDVGLEISGAPPEAQLGIAQDIVVTLREKGQLTRLVFTGGVRTEAESLTSFFTLNGTGRSPEGELTGEIQNTDEWVNPFGIPGIIIRQLSLQLGLTYSSPWIDNIGLHGNLRLGDIDGSISILVDSNDPDEFVLAGSTDRLTFLQLMSAMTAPTFVAYNALPAEVRQPLETVVNAQMEDVKVNIVPVPTQIGQVLFREPGVTLQGRMTVWGWGADAFVNVDYFDGLTVRAVMDAIDLGAGILQIRGTQGEINPQLRLRLGPSVNSELFISGLVSVLGITQELRIEATTAGLRFNIAGRLFNRFEAALVVTTPGIGDRRNFQVAATMQNDLLRFLKDDVSREIQQVARNASNSINTAQQEVDRAQQEVNRLSDRIRRRRQTVEQERATANQRIQQLERDVTNARNSLNSLNSRIQNLQREINRLSRQQRCTDIPLIGRQCIPDPEALAQAARLGTELAGLQAGLPAAQATLSRFEASLQAARNGVSQIPIDADPEIVSLNASLSLANTGLNRAREILQTTTRSLGAIAQINTFISQQGLNSLLDVRSAQFNANLDVAASGQVAIALEMVYMNQPRRLNLAFNFNAPQESARALAQLLLPRG
ncbi:Na-Ca exchanger/integrin-beta4 [Calothrix sp. NIES-4101]|nr:Na-Ca exchanger/integrin-beta4 [Calothrix sp. NIES-4101]